MSVIVDIDVRLNAVYLLFVCGPVLKTVRAKMS